jgi:DNA recombination protein RmuC
VAALRQEMQASLGAQAQTVATQIGQLTQAVTQQLGQVTQQLQTGVAATGALASDAQRAVSAQLEASTEMLGTIRQQLGEVQQAGRDLAGAARTIEMVLGGAQTRGSLGEVALERLLNDALPQASYEMQYRFSTGEVVDAVVRFHGKLLPIDSKFPLEDYRKMVEEGEDARKGLLQAVRSHADAIARKYILQDEGTLAIALMFVPSESVYYELLMTADAKGEALDAYCRSKGVIPVSPNTLYAHLNVILMGLRGMQIEENARRLLASLTGLKKQLDTFGEIYEKLGGHLRNAQQSYTDADRKLERARNALDQMAQGALPEAPNKALEATARD